MGNHHAYARGGREKGKVHAYVIIVPDILLADL